MSVEEEKKFEVIWDEPVDERFIDKTTWKARIRQFKVKGQVGEKKLEIRRWLKDVPLREGISVRISALEEFKKFVDEVIEKVKQHG
jgi:hypothetical protein